MGLRKSKIANIIVRSHEYPFTSKVGGLSEVLRVSEVPVSEILISEVSRGSDVIFSEVHRVSEVLQ